MLGWLHVKPEDSEQTRGQSEQWPLPSCDEFAYIANWFCELRMSFDYQEIMAWSELTGSTPNPSEIDLLISMAGTYSNSLIEYRDKKHNLIPPYDGRDQDAIDETISAKMAAAIERFKNAN